MAAIQYYDVILKPVITEKSMAGMGGEEVHLLSSSGSKQDTDQKRLWRRCSKAQRWQRSTP